MTNLFLMFLVIVGGLFFLAALALGLLGWWKKWIVLKRASFAVASGLLLCYLSAIYWSGDAGDFPFLRSPPVESDLPGSYSLAPHSVQMLKELGYGNFTAQIILHPDKTYEIKNIPHLWLYDHSFHPGYDTCTGTWSVELAPGTKVYDVRIKIDQFSDDSAYSQDQNKGFGTLRWVPFYIAAKTKTRQDYTLMPPLNNGDEGYILFVKDTNH